MKSRIRFSSSGRLWGALFSYYCAWVQRTIITGSLEKSSPLPSFFQTGELDETVVFPKGSLRTFVETHDLVLHQSGVIRAFEILRIFSSDKFFQVSSRLVIDNQVDALLSFTKRNENAEVVAESDGIMLDEPFGDFHTEAESKRLEAPENLGDNNCNFKNDHNCVWFEFPETI